MATENINQANYTDDNIKTLEGVEHIRLRPGMYIGTLGKGDDPADGIYVLLKEVVDNSIDEFSAGFGKQIQISVTEKEVSVRDFGRGIPLNSVVKAVSILNTGGKYDSKGYKKSVGLNGVGLKAVNALSSYFYVEAYRDGMCSYAEFSAGKLVHDGMKETKEKNGTYVKFTPDENLFVDYSYNLEFVESMIKHYSYLKKGLTLNLNGTPYISKNGLLDLINEKMSEDPFYAPIHISGEDIEIVITHGNSYGENITSFVNGQNTRDGGTHLVAVREAISKTLKEFFKTYAKKDFAPEDIRQGIIGAISIQIQEPIFANQAKTKLGSTYMWNQVIENEDGTHGYDVGPTIRSFVNDFVKTNLDNYLHMHKEIIPALQAKIRRFLQSRRRQRSATSVPAYTTRSYATASITSRTSFLRTRRNSESLPASSSPRETLRAEQSPRHATQRHRQCSRSAASLSTHTRRAARKSPRTRNSTCSSTHSDLRRTWTTSATTRSSSRPMPMTTACTSVCSCLHSS